MVDTIQEDGSANTDNPSDEPSAERCVYEPPVGGLSNIDEDRRRIYDAPGSLSEIAVNPQKGKEDSNSAEHLVRR